LTCNTHFEIVMTWRRRLAQHGGVAGLAAFVRRKEAESGQPTVAQRLQRQEMDLPVDAVRSIELDRSIYWSRI